jgi:hypothetical protein
MPTCAVLRVGLIIIAAAFLTPVTRSHGAPAQTSASRIVAALENITTLNRPGQDGYATIWDGNKYVQCRRLPDRALRCEAGGSLMQPSLERVLTPERVTRLAGLGWRLDPGFGNYVQTFPSDTASDLVAETIIQALREGYDSDAAGLQVQTTWAKSEACPPRSGPSQNLAGSVNTAPAMAASVIRACSYKAAADSGPSRPATSAAELIEFYGARVGAEIQRLRVNVESQSFAVFQAGIGYVQCAPSTPPPELYCEAQSTESWAALASVLTPDRVRRLHDLGFNDPGRAQNYWKVYALDQFGDMSIAHELLTVLHEIYGYTGQPTLEVKTEQRP